jgi:hypothetical protein
MAVVLPTESRTLLLPKGPEWSTVSKDWRDYWVANIHAKTADMKMICNWLFNSKTITVRYQEVVIGDPSGGYDLTETHHAGNANYGIQATTHPLPANILPSDGQISIPPIYGDSSSHRWIGDASSNTFSFYVFVYLGEWYWTPGIISALQVVGPLSNNSFVITQEDSVSRFTATFTITEFFYP